MKKRVLTAAILFASVSIGYSQVGIGTSSPDASAQLEVKALDKGVLIPRVPLKSTTSDDFTSAKAQSLLVFNTATVSNVTPGFYYWVLASGNGATTIPAHWERIVNQAQLDEAIGNITNIQADLTKVINLLKTAYPANNLVTGAIHDDTVGGGMVFTPGTTPIIEYVYFDGTNYVKKNITSDILNLIKGAESKTLLIKTTDSKKQYYLSEVYIAANTNANGVYTAPTQAVIDTWTSSTLPVGVYEIDIKDGVVNNIQEIMNSTINVTEGGQTFTTVEEYIQYIASTVDGNVIYKNIGTTVAPNWVFQYWDGTQYQTISLTDLVGTAQSKTLLVKTTDNKKQYYLSEAYIVANTNTSGVYAAPSQATINGWVPGTLPVGVYEIDVVNGVITNIEEIFTKNNSFTITGGNTFNNVQEYIEYISQNNLTNGVTKIVLDGTGQASFEQWNNTTNTWTPVLSTAFLTIVKSNETRTTIARSQNNTAYTEVNTDPKGTSIVSYEYSPEKGAKNYINITADMVYSITNNTDVQNAITNVLNRGGNVYFGDHDDDVSTPNVLYTIINGVKTPIDISGIVLNIITNNKQEVKNILGDIYSETTITNTGDTWIDGNKIYMGVYDAIILKGSADLKNPINLTVPQGGTMGKVTGIKIVDANTNQLINTTTTKVALTGTLLNFSIGTGEMYSVLPEAVPNDFNIKVIVEYSIAQ